MLAANPRPAGSEEERAAREYCAGVLRELGSEIEEHRFEYSAFPGSYGTPLLGLGACATFLAAGHLASRGRAIEAGLVLAMVAIAAAAASVWMARHGVLDLPLMRRSGINLIARRGAARIWLIAHLDSKSQPVPILVRAAAIVLLGAAYLVALFAVAAQLLGAPLDGWWVWITAAGVLVSLPVAASLVGRRSPGAADNASGVAAVLSVAEMLPRSAPFAIAVTTAEELGLAGARALARSVDRGIAINVDTVDDVGALTLMMSGRRRPRGLLSLLRSAARHERLTVAERRLLPGILMDGVALGDARWEVVNVSKGTLGTLWRVHTPRDDRSRMRGVGIAEASRLIATTLAGAAEWGC